MENSLLFNYNYTIIYKRCHAGEKPGLRIKFVIIITIALRQRFDRPNQI